MIGIWRNLRYDLPFHFVVLLTNWLPDNGPFQQLRGALAGRFLGSCGANLRLGRNITVYNPAQVHVGRDVYIALGTWIMADEPIHIEDEVLIGPYCMVVSAEHTRTQGSYRWGKVVGKPIRIGKGSWLAGRVTVTAGVRIGSGALVAAGAVVMADVPSDMVVGGIPARMWMEAHDP